MEMGTVSRDEGSTSVIRTNHHRASASSPYGWVVEVRGTLYRRTMKMRASAATERRIAVRWVIIAIRGCFAISQCGYSAYNNTSIVPGDAVVGDSCLGQGFLTARGYR